MKTLGKNADNDLYLEAGGLAILHDADAQCEVIEAILQTQQGELQFDEDRGIDYFGTVLQSPTYIDFWAAQVQEKILELDFVSTIEDFEYRFDSESSTLYWSMTVVNTDDDRLDLKNKKTVIPLGSIDHVAIEDGNTRVTTKSGDFFLYEGKEKYEAVSEAITFSNMKFPF